MRAGTHPAVDRRTVLDVVDVSLEESEEDRLTARFRAVADGEATEPSLTINGWAIGRGQRATDVEVLSEGEVVASVPINRKRPDLAEKFPDASGAPMAGFHVTLEGQGKGDSELVVRAVLEDETRAQVGTVRVKARRRGLLRSWWSP